uniref:Centrosome and spindle pole associated protein 1 n=2 Tax=Anthurium amnicola TaxID=1678845 RepID=A0A1D1ZI85_9ARAE
MAAKSLTTEAIALTEKKVDMSLDDIIKMSKKNAYKGKRPPRVSNKSRGFQRTVAPQRNFSKVQRFMDSRSSVRQGVLAQRRTNFRANQFPLTTELARKAVVAPIHNKMGNRNNLRFAAPSSQRRNVEGTSNGKEAAVKPRPQTLDALFANLKQQRMRGMNQRLVRGGFSVNLQRRRRQQQPQGRGGGGAPVGAGRRLSNFR